MHETVSTLFNRKNYSNNYYKGTDMDTDIINTWMSWANIFLRLKKSIQELTFPV